MNRERYDIIGTGTQGSHPYEVAIHWDDAPRQCPLTIALSEGCGHSSQGSCFPLAAILESIWALHLEICDCEWLRDLALEEQTRGRFFSADEILSVWQARSQKNAHKGRNSK